MKATVDEIRQRFDQDVERFSSSETGQTTTIDAPLVLDLIVEAAAATNPQATSLLDVGCGAGNYTLRLLEALPGLNVTLVDLSRPMLDRALDRVSCAESGSVTALQGDIRILPLGRSRFDIILAGAVLHHLREDSEWQSVFAKFYAALRPGGSLWISDLVLHSIPPVQAMMWQRYAEYLVELRDEAYRDYVFDYISHEDTPRPLLYQIDLLREVGFTEVDILHQHNCFAAFGAVKPATLPSSECSTSCHTKERCGEELS